MNHAVSFQISCSVFCTVLNFITTLTVTNMEIGQGTRTALNKEMPSEPLLYRFKKKLGSELY